MADRMKELRQAADIGSAYGMVLYSIERALKADQPEWLAEMDSEQITYWVRQLTSQLRAAGQLKPWTISYDSASDAETYTYLEMADRAQLIDWLMWNDPNGEYQDTCPFCQSYSHVDVKDCPEIDPDQLASWVDSPADRAETAELREAALMQLVSGTGYDNGQTHYDISRPGDGRDHAACGAILTPSRRTTDRQAVTCQLCKALIEAEPEPKPCPDCGSAHTADHSCEPINWTYGEEK